MKASILQLVSSSVVLGLMAGAVGLHWHEVNRATAGAAVVGDGEFAPVEPGQVMAVSWTSSEPALPEGKRAASASAAEMGATVEALNEIVSVLRELKDENRDLREQVKEANRDLTEMQFRLDTHSKSFRPLKTTTERAVPLQTQGSSHPLLPPKRR